MKIHWIYRICYPIVWILLFLFSRWEIKGKENIPHEGPLIVVANHMTNLDPPLLSVSLGRYAVFMAKEGLFRTKLSSYFIRGLGAFPVNRDRIQREALLTAEQTLNYGYILCIFPEGMRSRTAELRQGFSGSALIAMRTGVPVVPAAITGTEHVRGKVWLQRPHLTVSFGSPFHLPPPGVDGNRDKCAEYMMERIAKLLPSQYRGIYANRSTGNKT